MKEAFVSLDMDFLQSPSYIRNMYGITDYKSNSDYTHRIKRWITVEDIISKLPNKTHGDYSGDNMGSIMHLQRISQINKIGKKPVFINIDQHHNMYLHQDLHDLHHYSLSSFKPYNCNIGLFKEDLIEKFIWVVPNYFDMQDFNSHLSFQPEITKEENTIKFHFLKDIKIEFEFIKWSDFDFSKYDLKFLNVVTNKGFTNTTSEELDKLKNIISTW